MRNVGDRIKDIGVTFFGGDATLTAARVVKAELGEKERGRV